VIVEKGDENSVLSRKRIREEKITKMKVIIVKTLLEKQQSRFQLKMCCNSFSIKCEKIIEGFHP
jgi:tRNA 2-selenouridine synthase SelU